MIYSKTYTSEPDKESSEAAIISTSWNVPIILSGAFSILTEAFPRSLPQQLLTAVDLFFQ